MEDYIFLIIAVVLSIFGALNQNRKKKIALEEERQMEPNRPDMDNFLNFELMDMEDEEEEYERKARQEALEAARAEAREAARKAEYMKSFDNKNPSVFHAPKFKSTLPERKIKQGLRPQLKQKQEEIITIDNESPGIMEDFSLRKAVIYSEIMKPKFNS